MSKTLFLPTRRHHAWCWDQTPFTCAFPSSSEASGASDALFTSCFRWKPRLQFRGISPSDAWIIFRLSYASSFPPLFSTLCSGRVLHLYLSNFSASAIYLNFPKLFCFSNPPHSTPHPYSVGSAGSLSSLRTYVDSTGVCRGCYHACCLFCPSFLLDTKPNCLILLHCLPSLPELWLCTWCALIWWSG